MVGEMGHPAKIDRITRIKKFGKPNKNIWMAKPIFAFRMKKLVSVITGICMFYLASFGQLASIHGRVMHDSLPLAGATVEIKKLKQSVVSDEAGYFNILNIHPGNYLLHISVIGYEPIHENIRITEDIKEKVFSLTLITASMDAVVVTGTMKPVQKKESPILVEVYTPQFLKKNPVPSIFEALQNVNGVRPQLNCNVCNTGDIHINGLEGPYTMITIDGMPIVSSLSSVYGLFGIPTQLIERIEIVKGPASGLYGSEAIGGLINIITKSPAKAPSFTFNAMTTSWLEHSIDAGVKFKVGNKAASLLGVNYFNYDNPVDKNKDNFTDVTLQHRISVFNKLSLLRKHDRVASIAGRYFYEDRWGGDMRWNRYFRGTDSLYGESVRTGRWELIGNYQLPVHEKLMFSFSATGHHQDSYYGTTSYFADQKIYFGQLTWDKNIAGNHAALLGVAARHNYYDDNSTATTDTLTGRNKSEKFFLPGVFLQDEWKINKRHHFLFGLRYDYHPVHKNILTPRLAYKWSLNEKQIIRVNAGTGFRVVSLFTEEHAALTGARAVEVKEKLQPERSYNVNLNYSTQFVKGKTVLNFDASLWYTYFHNQIIPDYLTDPNKIIYGNLDGYSVSRGATVNLEGKIGNKLKLLTGFTLQDVAKFKNDNGKSIKENILLTEKWSGTWAISYSFPGSGISIDYTGNLYGPMQLPLISDLDPRRAQSPVWSIQNIQVTKKISPALEIYGGVKNLLNWTPVKNNQFIIARSHDPFDKKVEFDANGKVIATTENPYALTFDPAYVYAPNQGIRVFTGLRLNIK
jgi:outer membrane receptor for ferrienterochelin and colicins